MIPVNLLRCVIEHLNAGIIGAMTSDSQRTLRISRLALVATLLFLLAACGQETPTPVMIPATGTPTVLAPTPSTVPSSPTPAPLAARVNGEGLTLAQFQAELERYRSASGAELTAEDRQRVLDALIDGLLLAQGAREAGFTPDESQLTTRVDDLANRLGGVEALSAWMAENGYTPEGFRRALAGEIAAAWMRDRIAAEVPEAVEQVHARQILLFSAEGADEMLAQLQAGAEFSTLAAEADPLTKGDLGWFPRGYLLEPEMEEAAFRLEPGMTSAVIQTETGYHILQVTERDPQRPLDPGARLALQTAAIQNWLAERYKAGQIEILAP